MSKDIRNIIKEEAHEVAELSANHRGKFEKRLLTELHEKPMRKSHFSSWMAAASIAVLIGLGIAFFPESNNGGTTVQPQNIENKNTTKQISLGNISPELKTIEAYYTNNINYELSQLDLTKENKELFDGYIAKIGELTKEYKSLTKELNTQGVNDNIINALIGNLQLRLQLLKRLQKQLKEIKNVNSNQNEIQTI